MPELPEVEFGRKLLARVAVGRRIERVRCADDRLVFAGVAPRTVARALRGRRVEAARRHGKHLWLELDRRPWPLFHFGMTGAFRARGDDPLPLESAPREPDRVWPPRFTKIHLWLDDGGELVMTNARRLGRIRLQHDPWNEEPLVRLGFDPLTGMPPLPDFRRRLGERGGAVVKGLLLDQGFAAGVGNWIADEVLFQAGIDPRRRVRSLSPDEVKALHRALRGVIRRAVSVDARKERFPRSWLFHARWGRNDGAALADGTPVEHLTVAGRTTAWVPSRQK